MQVGHRGLVIGVEYSSDGRLLGSLGEEGTLRLWDAKTGNLRAVADPLTRTSPNGPRISVRPGSHQVAFGTHYPDQVVLWDWESQRAKTLDGACTDWGCDVAFSPDGQRLVSSLSGVTVHSLLDGSAWTAPDTHDICDQVAWSSDGELIACAYDENIDLHHYGGDKSRSRLRSAPERAGYRIRGLAFAPKGPLLAVSLQGVGLEVWDTKRRALVNHVPSQFMEAQLTWSPDGERVAFGAGERLRQNKRYETSLNIVPARRPSPKQRFGAAFDPELHGLAWSPDGATLAVIGRNDRAIKLLDASSGAPRRMLASSAQSGDQPVWSPRGAQFALPRHDSSIEVWNAEDVALELVLPKLGYTPSFNHDGSLIAIASMTDGSLIELFETKTGKLAATLKTTATTSIRNLTFSPTDDLLAASFQDDDPIEVWDVKRHVLARSLSVAGAAGALAFSHDGRWLACSCATRAWRTTTWQPSGLETRGSTLFSTRPDTIVMGDELRSLDNGKASGNLPPAPTGLGAVVVAPASPNQQRASFGERTALWDGETGQIRAVVASALLDREISTTFSPDGRFVLLNGWRSKHPLGLLRVADGALLTLYTFKAGDELDWLVHDERGRHHGSPRALAERARYSIQANPTLADVVTDAELIAGGGSSLRDPLVGRRFAAPAAK